MNSQYPRQERKERVVQDLQVVVHSSCRLWQVLQSLGRWSQRIRQKMRRYSSYNPAGVAFR